jgi:outer membrane lipoprotein-sorting protein
MRKVSRYIAAVTPFCIAPAFCVLSFGADEPKPLADPTPVLQALQQKMSTVRSFCIEFTQERQLKLFAESLKSRGYLFIDRNNQIRWETTEPYQSFLVANQKSIGQFEFEDGKWKKLSGGFPQIKQVMDQMVAMHQGRLDALKANYDISAATNSMTVITLAPRDKTVKEVLSSIQLQLPPDLSLTREVVMNEPGGDLTRIVFGKELRDVTFPPGTFDTDKPIDIKKVLAATGAGK